MGGSAPPLELHGPDGAFGAIEEWLGERGFFAPGGEELVADLFLGYGLSLAIRRGATTAPPEPCPTLPLAARAVRPDRYVVDHDNAEDLRIGEWDREWSNLDHRAAVDDVRAAIARGEVYQVNLVEHLSTSFSGTPSALAARLAPLAPLHVDPLVGPGWAVVSASPELFLARRGRRAWTRRSRQST
jgi:para-aminobenzoate synthetase component 1